MPFCANCGAAVEGKFCAKCGSAVMAGAPPAGTVLPNPVVQQPAAAGAPMADNVASALCYVLGLITGIIFLVIAPYNQNRTVRFHAFQAIFMHVGVIAFYIVCMIIFGILHLWMLGFLWLLIWLAMVVLWIFLIVSAYQGKQIELPIVGPIARQQAG